MFCIQNAMEEDVTPAKGGDEVGPRLSAFADQLSVGYRSVGTMVCDVLRDAILQGVLAPGERLRQEALAESIGVSRVPVRSALLQLEAEGLVQFHGRRGAAVRSLTKAQIEEIYEMRSVLESYALRKSMETMTPELVERVSHLAKSADAQGEGQDFLKARDAFYRELYQAESSPLMMGMIEDLRVKVGRYLLGWRLVSEHEHSHQRLVELVANGDTNAALAELNSHLNTVRDGIVALMERDNRSASGD